MTLKIYLISVLIFVCTLQVFSQKRGDVGIFAGAGYYLGEINPTVQFKEALPALGIIYRHSFDLRYALRTSIIKSSLQGHDSKSSYFYNKERNRNFKSDIYDITTQVEFNFLPYLTTSDIYNVSTYVTAGLSYFIMDNNKIKNHIAIPFGIGVKVNITKRISTGAELVLRKTFTDEIDGLGETPNPLNEPYITIYNANKFRQRSLPNRNDLYSFGGVFLTYKLFYTRTRCPAYEDKSFKE